MMALRRAVLVERLSTLGSLETSMRIGPYTREAMRRNMSSVMKSTLPPASRAVPTNTVMPTPERRIALASDTDISTASSTFMVMRLSDRSASFISCDFSPTIWQARMSLRPSR